MYIEDDNLLQPDNDQLKVWRYMDFTKFLSLLDTQKLYLSRSDKFEDPFEGALPQRNVEGWQDELRVMHPLEEDYNFHLNEMRARLAATRENMAISCWHMNEFESDAMWKLYLRTGEGIAIQSTVGRLRESIVDPKDFVMGLVEYVNYDEERIDPNIALSPFRYKRSSFQHERELRLIFDRAKHNHRARIAEMGGEIIDEIQYGVQMAVDLNQLIEAIYVAPTTPAWLTELVGNVIVRYGYDFEVRVSRMADKPFM